MLNGVSDQAMTAAPPVAVRARRRARRPDPRVSAGARAGATSPAVALQPALGAQLGRILAREGLSVDQVEAFSGLCRKTLEAVIAGEAIPHVSTLWRIANAVGLPFGSLVPADQPDGASVQRLADQQVFTSKDGNFTMRPLLPFDAVRLVDFYEVTVAPGHVQESPADAPGTMQCLIVVGGQLEIIVGHEPALTLTAGDAMNFPADAHHSYHNTGTAPAVVHLVTTHVNLAQ
jgi:transcriptional regulator with XRE-family HTH domain